MIAIAALALTSCTIEETNVCYTDYDYETVVIDGTSVIIPVPVTYCYD